MAEDNKKAKLTFGDKELELPILSPTVGPDVIDIRKLYSQGDVFTYDPGFTSTAATDSSITFIDGDKGILRPGILDYPSLLGVDFTMTKKERILYRANCCTAAIRSTNSPKNRTSSKSATCCSMGSFHRPPNLRISSIW